MRIRCSFPTVLDHVLQVDSLGRECLATPFDSYKGVLTGEISVCDVQGSGTGNAVSRHDARHEGLP